MIEEGDVNAGDKEKLGLGPSGENEESSGAEVADVGETADVKLAFVGEEIREMEEASVNSEGFRDKLGLPRPRFALPVLVLILLLLATFAFSATGLAVVKVDALPLLCASAEVDGAKESANGAT